MESKNNIIGKAIVHAKKILSQNVPEEYSYHNINHTSEVVEEVRALGEAYELKRKDIEILELAAWFHDTGMSKKYKNHEEHSIEIAKEFLESEEYKNTKIEEVLSCIKATKMPQNPQNLLEQILCDADLSHLGKKNFMKRNELFRQERNYIYDSNITDKDWYKDEITFLENHSFHTPIAQELYGTRKEKNIVKLKSLLKSSQIASNEKASELVLIQDNIIPPPDRGIETMFRNNLRGHLSLSAIADNKANIMLSINAVIISVSLSSLVPKFFKHPEYIEPTLILVTVSIISMFFAILSTIPKVTEGLFTKEDIKLKKTNLLFFGNFHNMPLDDFNWGINEMMKDREYLYGSMIKDFYFLGVVLNKKYKYLRICYNIFMAGMLISVISFMIAFI